MPGQMTASKSLQTGILLLALTGLVAVGLESVSFGHEHLAAGHDVRHHHVFFGPHDHPEPQPDEEPAPHDHGTPEKRRNIATVVPGLALFQPVPISLLAAPTADPLPVVGAPAPRRFVQVAARPTVPRAPPSSSLLPIS